MEVMMARFDLTDEEWAIIAPLLPKQGRGSERKDDRKVLNGIFISCAPVLPGVIYRTAMAPEPRSTIAMFDGASGVCGGISSKRSLKNVGTLWFS